ncbi:hypothetical protein BT93_B0499 [Corymbia citriodora subsp. variegata]|nr:hypothetical protein BT93_B0499 [Corymbia citriodora subsp. variegata]
MAIGEIFLGSFFQVLFNKLTTLGWDYAQREGISTALLDEWKGMLETISAVLDDAEDKQLGGNRLVELWLDDVRDLAYDMEDLLNEFVIEATQVKSGAKSSTSKGQKERKLSFFSQDGSSRSNPNPCSLVSRDKVQEINGRLEKIVIRKARLSLKENVMDRSNCTNKRLPSTSLPETQFFGREKEEVEIMQLLISEVENSDAKLSIVPIVGMGGVGKMAMAQQLYNNPKMSSYFKKRTWVCAPDVFDVLDITKTVLQSITKLPCEGKDLNWLQVKLKDHLSRKKFLVVLDDVWNEKCEEWTSLLKPFEARGSKIIITTRNHPVYSMIGATPYFLNELSIDNCTHLLAYHALGVKIFEGHPDLETIGKKIAKKCKGLPLAAKILGSLLRNKENADEWEAILNDKIWDVVIGQNGEVLLVLRLRYVHLPSYLKRCFVYCAIFPKDYGFERDKLALLWIGEGFLDGQKAKENILTFGRDYFNELVSRSFFQQSSVDTSKFFMHDLLNDLAKSIADTTYFTSGESQLVVDEDDTSFKDRAGYASFVSGRYVTSNNLRAYARMKVLRSLMMLTNRRLIKSSKKVLLDLLTNLKSLRVLSLCHCDIIEVPNCVSDLKHLRYLNLSYTSIKRLPESIGTLCKLQALILKGCLSLSMLPSNITNLELLVLELQKVEEVRDATNANLFGKEGLSNLILVWDKDFRNPQNDEHKAQLPSLKELFLEGLNAVSMVGVEFCRTKKPFPSLTILCPVLTGTLPCQLDRLIKLEFHSCLHLNNSTSVIRLPSLCELHFANCNKEILRSLVNLTSLTSLKIEDLAELVCFDSGFMSHLVKLKELHIRRCDKLTYLLQDGDGMRNLTCLQELAIKGCPQFTSFVAREGEIELLCNLEIKELWGCASLEKLPSKMHALRHLSILNCPKIMGLSIPSNDPNSKVTMSQLEYLKISNYDFRISFPFAKIGLAALKTLIIEDCKGVELLEEITIVESLKSLYINGCMNLGSLPNCLHMLVHLTHLKLSGCPILEIKNFPPLPLTLSSLSLKGCPKIKSIANCNCKNMKQPVREWGLPMLTSLTYLFIDGRSMGGERDKNVERLSNGLQNHLSSLKWFPILDCPKLRDLPKDGLPPSLELLCIQRCKDLEDRCSKLTGDYWPSSKRSLKS